MCDYTFREGIFMVHRWLPRNIAKTCVCVLDTMVSPMDVFTLAKRIMNKRPYTLVLHIFDILLIPYRFINILNLLQILNCIHAIIQTDKSPECRRASVMVISSLIKGLGTESLFFLKEALLPMYRTLKQLYSDEKEDDAVRLHAQIALEELNSIMKELMAPYLK